jgi:beta-1,4-mannosyltransferase
VRAQLGYYAHHHGSGHLRRAEQVLASCRTPHTLLTSHPDASGPDLVRLPLDVGGAALERDLPTVLHHAPVGHAGLRARTALLTDWVRRTDPALLVVDVSVEVTLLARLSGLATAVVRQHGDRTDPPHRAAYESAERLLAFWPRWAEHPGVSSELRDRTRYVGATSRLQRRVLPRSVACEEAGLDPDDRHVLVVRGFGGDAFTGEQLEAAATATPEHRWIVLGEAPRGRSRGGPLDVRGVVADPVALFSVADVIVTHGGQNAVADAAAAGARLVVLPQERPFDEQVRFAEVLADHGCAVVRSDWPDARSWPTVLAATDHLDVERLRTYVGDGAELAADELDGLVADLVGGATAPPRAAAGAATPRPRPRRAAASRAPVRVASVPATHVYVRRLAHPDIEVVADPTGDDLRCPSLLDAAWWRANPGAADVLHVHFGFEFHGPDQLEELCDELDQQRVPVVYTCHDLRNPNHPTPEVHDAGLAVWMRRATEVVTLTDWAADRIAERFGRRATVLPHPHVVPLEELRRRAAAPRPRHTDGHRIGLHLKSKRANTFGASLVAATLDAIAPLEGVRLRLDLHPDVLDPRSPVHDPELADLAWRTVQDRASPLDLHVHHYLSDDELWQLIAGVDTFLLPYRFGTHSGLLEACRDLGTAVIAPSCGAYADQGADHVFAVDDDGFDPTSLREAIVAAVRAGPPPPLPVGSRGRQRREVAGGYLAVHRAVLARARAGAAA